MILDKLLFPFFTLVTKVGVGLQVAGLPAQTLKYDDHSIYAYIVYTVGVQTLCPLDCISSAKNINTSIMFLDIIHRLVFN
jgi:hypothetical protein